MLDCVINLPDDAKDLPGHLPRPWCCCIEQGEVAGWLVAYK